MQEIQSLLDKYRAGNASKAELQQLLQLLENDDAGLKGSLEQQYSSDLKKELRLLSEQQSEAIWQAISRRTAQVAEQPARVVRMPLRAIGWAAACLILIIAGWYLLRPAPSPAQKEPVVSMHRVEPALKQVTNTTGKEMSITLSDNSVVQLQPGSALSWYENFSDHKRDISLRGKAFFKVAKDATRPFTVYADNIATTALGTQFSVNTLINNKVEVKLFEGKVQIASTGKALAMKPVYLLPGQSFLIDWQLKQYAINKFNNPPAGNHSNGGAPKPDESKAVLAFNKEPLQHVFKKIETQFNVHISYNDHDVSGLRFTGTFLQSDSLSMVLSVICNMNGLSFTQNDTSITITKTK